MLKKIILFLILQILFNSCSLVTTKKAEVNKKEDLVVKDIPPTTPPAEISSGDVNKAIEDSSILDEVKADPELLTGEKKKIFDEFNENVQKWIEYFTIKDKERFQRYLNRGLIYKTVVQSILQENDIPPEFYYLAMIESGYETHAYSRARAMGVWQFIKGTGNRYDLKSNYYIDERRDPIRATEAAAQYLKDLYTAFQSWYLVMAAYNSGENRVLGAIIRGKTRDFWELAEKKLLPAETRNYVPKFLAATKIGMEPEKYGLVLEPAIEFPEVVSIEIPSPVSLKKISELSGIEYQTLKQLNPHILRDVTPPNVDFYEIWFPANQAEKIKTLVPEMSKHKIANLRKNFQDDGHNRFYYTVRRGDTLGNIARRHGISITKLIEINNLTSNQIYAKQKLRVSPTKYHPPLKGDYHLVEKGDTLIDIANKYNLSIGKLKKINNLRTSRIYPGMRLKTSLQ